LPGRYGITLQYRLPGGPVPPGVSLGELSVLRSDGRDRVTLSIPADKPVTLEYRLGSPRPLRIEFRYSRTADMIIESVKLTRMQ